MKALIFDSSSLISLAMNGLYDELVALKKIFNGRFIIPKEVKEETIDKPLTIKKFELEALKLKELLDNKILESPASLNINEREVSVNTQEFMNRANSTFHEGKNNIRILDLGESACIALSEILNKKSIENVMVVDERTARMLVEKPENLEKLLSKKLHTNIRADRDNFKKFKGFKIIRSAELVYLAYKKGLVNLKKGPVLDALLYAVKFKGCSISEEEIREIENIK
ncbi:hypothetical protein HYT23_06555 [Candidatus Pacearchaeota archaeon]|nr:hypothetical protein [Candidatus Pacearchaeota archaeon]